MTPPTRRRVDLADDRGASMVLALVIVTVVAVMVTALLSFTGTSLRTTVALRAQGSVASTADGAAQAAINELKRNPFNNDSGSPTHPKCFGNTATSDTLVLPSLVPGTTGAAANSAAVRCTPQAGTGVDGGVVPITDANKPGQAILTLSSDPGVEQGLYLKPLSATVPFLVKGGVASSSNIVVDGGTLKTTTDVFAAGDCIGQIDAQGKKVCNDPSTVAADPGAPGPTAGRYKPMLTTVPAAATVPATCSGSIVEFRPGYYDDAKALSDLTNSNSCNGKVWWFHPGTYYFDFQNTGKSAGINDPHQWWISVGQLVAGTPADDGTEIAEPLVPAPIPGACQNPIDSPTAKGVEFVFGGDSQMHVRGTADVEICGTYHKDRPPTAVYGLRDSTPATPVAAAAAAAATSVAQSVSGTFAPPPAGDLTSALSAADGVFATSTVTRPNASSTLTLAPFLSGPGVPTKSVLSSARLRLIYGGSAEADARSVKVTPTFDSGTGTPLTFSLPTGALAQTGSQTVELDLLANATLAAEVRAKGVTGLTVEYVSKMSGSASVPKSEQLDAVLLDMTYTGPALRAQTDAAVPGNCLAKPYSQTGGAGCAMIYVPARPTGKFYVQGTTYAPRAAIDISLNNAAEQVMRFGVISRVLVMKETGGFDFTGAVIEIPDNSWGFGMQGTVVHLDVYVCPGSSTCSTTTGKLSLRTKVLIKDPSVTRRMVVQSWAVQR